MDNSKTAFSCTKEYEIRSGALNLGQVYELKMVVLISLRCLVQDFDDIRIAFNAAGLGAWDDMVVHAQRKHDEDIKIFMQLKHGEKKENIQQKKFLADKGDYSLSKYYEDIVTLKERLAPKSEQKSIIKDLGTFNNMYFVLFTNKGTNKYEFLKSSECDSISFLNTGNNNDNLYKFDLTKVSTLSNLPNLDNSINFRLYAEQSHVNHLDEIIKTEIKNVFRHFRLADVNIETVSEKFIKYITDWAMGKLGNHYYLTKQAILYKLTELLFFQHKLDFAREQFDFYDCSQKRLWNEIIKDKAITVVDSEEEVIKFLKLYVGSEIRPYYQKRGKTWSCEFSNKEQKSFYKQYAHLKKAMFKIVGNNGKITLLSIYKCLWFNEHLPLLLKINTFKDYDNILKILKLTDFKLKVIIVNKTKLILNTENVGTIHFSTLFDVNDENRLKVLNSCVKLQGRSFVILKAIIDSSLFQHINCNAIINILLGNFNIGIEYEPLAEYFIERSLLKIFLYTDVLDRIDSDICLIEINKEIKDTSLRNNLDTLIASYKTKVNIIIFDEEISKQIKKLKLREKPIHRLILHNMKVLEWKESFGSTDNIRKYQYAYRESSYKYVNKIKGSLDDTNWINGMEDIVANTNTNNIFNSVNIVSASPGMGKSTLLDYIALTASTKMWVLNIKLIDHVDYYDITKSRRKIFTAQDHLKYFNDSILPKHNCKTIKLAQAVFQKFVNANRVLVMLDGYDEVSISYKKEVIEITNCIHKAGFCIWLTTRPHWKTDLEDKFANISSTLRPFSVDDQKIFLNRYFKHIGDTVDVNTDSHQTLIREFVGKLLQATRDNLNDIDGEFTGIPLQTKLLANAFSNTLKDSLSTGTIQFEHRFDLLYLCEEFLKIKDNILRDKFGKGAKDMKMVFQNHQQLFALKLIFPNHLLYRLDIDGQLNEYYRNNEDHIQFLQQDGVTTIQRKGTRTEKKFQVNFVHRTFAEYIAASWLLNNFNSELDNLRWTAKFLLQERFEDYINYEFLFRMLDSMLAKDCPLHLLIINGQIEEAQKLVKLDSHINMTDVSGRSFIHMIALYGVNERRLQFKDDSKANNKMIDLFEQISYREIINIKDSLGHSPLDYALLNGSFAVANKLCEKINKFSISINILMNNFDETCTCLSVYKHTPLFRTLLPFVICQKLLVEPRSVNQNVTIASYCNELFINDENVIETSNDYTNKYYITISELLQKINIKSTNESYYYDLRFAAAFGTLLNVLDLISSEYATVNEQNFNNYCTPLYCAVKRNCLKTVKLLLYYGESANELSIWGDTPLHYAAKNGYADIARELLSHQADPNVQNEVGHTPLVLAVQNKHTDTATLLLSYHANVNIKDSFDCLPLHYAAENGLNEIISHLIKDVDINFWSWSNSTPLRVAIFNGHFSTARLLLRNGANCNIPNRDGELPLHTAAAKGRHEILAEILSKTVINNDNNFSIQCSTCVKNEAVNIANEVGQTPLHLSVFSKLVSLNTRSRDCLKTLKFLLNNGANVNLQDIDGNTALHNVCDDRRFDKEDRKSATALLLDKDADVNLKNKNGESALDLAVRNNYTEVISLL